ncbi:MAG: hypothetical protein ACKOPE_09265 [Novosphingobium sp.]
MNKPNLAGLVGAIAVLAPAAAHAGASREYHLGYFLPKTVVAAKLAQRIVACPSPENPDGEYESRGVIVAKAVPDYTKFFQLDAKAGFLAKRTTELNLNADGTIASANATVEGQGGPLLLSLIKTVASVGGLGARDVPAATGSPGALTCSARISGLIKRRNDKAAAIEALEARQAREGLAAGETELLKRSRDDLEALDDALTLTSNPAKVDDQSDSGSVAIAPIDYSPWFGEIGDKQRARIPGGAGATLSWEVNLKAKQSLRSAATSLDPNPGPNSAVYYRRPVPVAVKLVPLALTCPGASDPCSTAEDVRPTAAGLYADLNADMPQLSGYFRLPIGRGGLFGSRQIAVTFDESGAPTQLKYGSESGSAEMAAQIDALRDAKLDATNRRIEMLKARKELRELEQDLAKAE